MAIVGGSGASSATGAAWLASSLGAIVTGVWIALKTQAAVVAAVAAITVGAVVIYQQATQSASSATSRGGVRRVDPASRCLCSTGRSRRPPWAVPMPAQSGLILDAPGPQSAGRAQLLRRPERLDGYKSHLEHELFDEGRSQMNRRVRAMVVVLAVVSQAAMASLLWAGRLRSGGGLQRRCRSARAGLALSAESGRRPDCADR